MAPIAARAQGVVIGLSGMVLLVVCLNISGMVVVRSAMRERELAVRLAIGASRGRLMQYLLSEAFVMAVLGGTLAILVLFLVPAGLAWLSGADSARSALAFQPDGVMLAIGLGLCFATSLLFGLFPAFRFSRPSLVVALKDEAGGGGRRVGRSQRWTAATQAAIAIPFLVLGGVRLDQVRTTAAADLGFDPKGLFAAPLDVAGDEITSADARLPSPVGPGASEAGERHRGGYGRGWSASRLPAGRRERVSRGRTRTGRACRRLASVNATSRP